MDGNKERMVPHVCYRKDENGLAHDKHFVRSSHEDVCVAGETMTRETSVGSNVRFTIIPTVGY